jgi:hypothetical protein
MLCKMAAAQLKVRIFKSEILNKFEFPKSKTAIKIPIFRILRIRICGLFSA